MLAELRKQYPLVLVIAPDGIEYRAEPAYAWLGERLVRHPIPVSAISAVYAPLDQHAALRCSLDGSVEIWTLEDLRVLHLVAEAIPAA